MKLVIIHNHFRPGGVRRVIELATPHLVDHSRGGIRAVVLATGETPASAWLRAFRRRLHRTPVELVVWRAFGYASELALDAKTLGCQVRHGVLELLSHVAHDDCLIWAHNLGLGRNLWLARELASACHSGGIPLVAHHHDWWFENRWHHFAAVRQSGFRVIRAVAGAVFAASPHIAHVAINHADAAVLQKHFPGRAGWLPHPVHPESPPPSRRVAAARAWLRRQIGTEGPVWLLPCRLLRRKNIAEALLITRWLRPEATLVTTAGVSSAEEREYADALAAAAQAHGWPLRLGVLQGGESRKPSVPALLAAGEAVLLTSLQEGFGLPYLEAAVAHRPLIARELPNVASDLAGFGFSFPQSYRELRVAPELFDWREERKRQTRLFARWKGLMPRAATCFLGQPAILALGEKPCPVPFSRLTLTAQLAVLAQPIEQSWSQCAPLNPFLTTWRERAAAGRLQVSPWPRSAAQWLDGATYARRFHQLIPSALTKAPRASAGHAAQAEFLRRRLRAENLYPLLWDSLT